MIGSKVQKASVDLEYKKTGINPEDIAILRRWVKTQPHLPPEIDDLDLILAYCACDQSLERAKQRLDTNITQRTLYTIFQDRVVDKKVIHALNTFVFYLLETPTYENNPTLYVELTDYSIDNFDFLTMSRSALMLLDLYQYELGVTPETTVIVNCVGVTFGYLAKLDIQALQQNLNYVKDGILGKLKEAHFINTPPFAATVLRILRPIIPTVLLNVAKFHEIGSTDIEKIIPKEALPKECGGQSKSLKEMTDYSIQKLLANTEFFEQEKKKRVNEALRQGKPNDLVDIFGSTGGSFKKLDID